MDQLITSCNTCNLHAMELYIKGSVQNRVYNLSDTKSENKKAENKI